MKRKNLMTALMCAFCMAAAPVMVMAEETTEDEVIIVDEEEEAAEEEAEEETAETDEILLEERPAYVASEYVNLGEYKGLTVEITTEEVTEEMVQERFELNVSNFGTDVMDVLTEGTVQTGDIANIDYVGKKDDVAFDGGTAEGYDLEIGSGAFIDGFEDGLIGVEIGSTVDLELTFPEGYQAAELAGQDVIFTVTVNEVKRMPEEITDEMIDIGTDGKYTDAASYKEYVRSILEENAAEERENTILTSLVNQVAVNSEVTGYPQELVDYCVASMNAYYSETAAMYGMELEAFIEAAMALTLDEFNEQLLTIVQQSLNQELCLAAIGEAEGFEVTDEEYQEGVANYMTMYGFADEEEFLTSIGGENVVRLNLIQKKVTDFLIENAIVVEVEAEAAEETTEEAAE